MWPPLCMSIKGGDVAQMRRVARRLDVRAQSGNRTGWGRMQTDDEGRMTIEAVDTEHGRVPDVCGMGLKEALFLLENAGLRVTFRGHGAVATQSLEAGTQCSDGDRIEILLR